MIFFVIIVTNEIQHKGSCSVLLTLELNHSLKIFIDLKIKTTPLQKKIIIERRGKISSVHRESNFISIEAKINLQLNICFL